MVDVIRPSTSHTRPIKFERDYQVEMTHEVNGLEQGARLYNAIRDAYLEAAAVCIDLATPEDRAEFKTAFGRNPKDILKAVARFPEAFLIENDPDLWDILAAIHLSRVKSDDDATELWIHYKDEKSFDDLREAVKELCAPRARKPCGCGHPNNAKCGAGK